MPAARYVRRDKVLLASCDVGSSKSLGAAVEVEDLPGWTSHCATFSPVDLTDAALQRILLKPGPKAADLQAMPSVKFLIGKSSLSPTWNRKRWSVPPTRR